MCGIAGLAQRGGLDSGAEALVRLMCDGIAHRGPDDEGYHVSRQAALGIRRLSIIDLDTGHQPVFNEDRTVAVVLNGEIYNFRQIREQLVKKGHRFATKGDSETIAHLYEEYGAECVKHLRGMFAFALWDENQQRLLLARDRMGIKPLFYSHRNGRLTFGSEIKCILAEASLARGLNLQALAKYLMFLYVPAPDTMFEGILELPPAHYLTWSDGRVELQRYWRLHFSDEGSHSENYYLEGFTAKLADAVQSHLVADVPLGAFLSGGIDSGTVVALMTGATGQPAETFTVGFEGGYGFYDERAEARLVARRYQSRHHEFVVRPNVGDVLPRILAAFDQPLADSSAIPNFYICQLARQHVTVALSGLGGDELMGGYERYLGILLGDRARKLPLGLRRLVAKSLASLPDWGGTGRFSTARLKRLAESTRFETAEAYLRVIATFHQEELKQLLVGDAREALEQEFPADLVTKSFQECGSNTLTNQMLYADSTGYLPGDLLPLTDRMSMIHSLEVRVPFLDHKLVEFAATIPAQYKVRGLTKKYLLREVARGLLPKEIVHREKRGFSIPLAFWLRQELREFVEAQLSSERVARLGYFDPKGVSVLLQEHFEKRANHENRIWALLLFVLWHDLYLEGRTAPLASVPLDA
ncbi:MAG: asparagine synthase (glutamine-hydrolyzing) [Terriglobales bacterium]